MGHGGSGRLGMDYNNPVCKPWGFDFGRSRSPWPSGDPSQCDDLGFLVPYMVAEMNTNAHGPFVKGLAELNRFPPDDCIEDLGKLPSVVRELVAVLGLGGLLAECVGKHLTNRKLAMFLWAGKVKDKADWDHKPIIKRRFRSSLLNSDKKHLYGGHIFGHDIWSNIHYGYVGIAAGFPEQVLILGAAVAHTWDELGDAKSREEWWDIFLGKLGDNPMIWDDPKDRAAIEVGIRLYRYRPERVTVRDLMGEVWFSRGSLAIRPYNPLFDQLRH